MLDAGVALNIQSLCLDMWTSASVVRCSQSYKPISVSINPSQTSVYFFALGHVLQKIKEDVKRRAWCSHGRWRTQVRRFLKGKSLVLQRAGWSLATCITQASRGLLWHRTWRHKCSCSPDGIKPFASFTPHKSTDSVSAWFALVVCTIVRNLFPSLLNRISRPLHPPQYN